MTPSGKVIKEDPREIALKEARAKEIQSSIAAQVIVFIEISTLS